MASGIALGATPGVVAQAAIGATQEIHPAVSGCGWFMMAS
jgi:hypothetical protein